MATTLSTDEGRAYWSSFITLRPHALFPVFPWLWKEGGGSVAPISDIDLRKRDIHLQDQGSKNEYG